MAVVPFANIHNLLRCSMRRRKVESVVCTAFMDGPTTRPQRIATLCSTSAEAAELGVGKIATLVDDIALIGFSNRLEDPTIVL